MEIGLFTQQVPEWTYSLRREMQLIVPNVYLGPFSAACNGQRHHLVACGITHIVCVRHTLEARFIRPVFPKDFKYLTIEIADAPCENIISKFPVVTKFIDEAINQRGNVLVHGNTGISRSAAFVTAYIMTKYESTFRQALDCVKRRRFCIMPNEGFLQQLSEYEAIYQAQIMYLNKNDHGQENSSSKRKIIDVELTDNHD